MAVACVVSTETAAAPPASAGAAAIASIVEQEISAGNLPGAVVVVGVRGKEVLRRAFGDRSLVPERKPATIDTIYDAASLTKVMATAVAIQQLAEQGKIELDRPAAAYWPAFAANGKADITVRHLLTHYAVLPAGIATSGWSGKDEALRIIAGLKPLGPAGSRFLYSDVDFIVLGELVARVSGQTLDAYAMQHIFQPLGMRDTLFRPPTALRDRIAPNDSFGGQLRWGEVHDPIAYRMGGVAGHAGVFTTADDLALFAHAMLGGPGAAKILKPQSLAALTTPQSPAGGASLRGLGWDIDSAYASFLAPHFSLRSFGHTGYTGTMLWIDPQTQSFLIVLSNRLHPDSRGNVLPMFRRLADATGALARDGQRLPAMTGIDVLEADGFRQLLGRRVGLLTNNAARDGKGRRTVDVLHGAPGVRLVTLLSPEHGLGASAEGRIDSSVDAATGLPVHSLYGKTFRPTPDMLAGLDTLVIDLPDVGTRYYTYATTLAYAMEEAGRQHVQVIVLDRPNPIRADVVQGPVLDPDLVSFVTYHPLPVRHGMTMGELARFFRNEKNIDARLQVIGVRQYRRSQWYDQTGLAWRPPSPNLRSLTETVLYPGVAMVEGANVSVGRGTDTPFEILGAPWIDATTLANDLRGRNIAGVRIDPASFTPRESAYANLPCQGVRFTLIDRDRLDTPLLGLELIGALHRLYPGQFTVDRTIGLLGSRQSLEAVKAGVDPLEIQRLWAPALETFKQRRLLALMY
ncbi:MAG: exo-beta-N-acetylmuramidase NamZ domain-containing protein [Rhodospirillaceae bacterium]